MAFVDQKKYKEWHGSNATVEVRRISPHGAVLKGRIADFDTKTLLIKNGEREALVYIADVSTVCPVPRES